MPDGSIEPSAEAYSKSPRQTENERITSERQVSTRTSQSLTQRLKGFVLQEPAVRERHSFRSQLYRMYDGRPFH